MKTNKLYKLIVPLLFLAGSIGVAWGQGTEPVKEDKYLKLDLPYRNIQSIDYSSDKVDGHPNDNTKDGFGLYDHSVDTWYKYKNGESPEITFTFQKEETVSSITIMGGGDSDSHAKTVSIKGDDTQEKEYTVEIKNTQNATYSFELGEPIKTQTLTITLEPQESKWVTVQDIWIYVLPTIQHKPAKWYDKFPEFTNDKFYGPEENIGEQLQATHTMIDTIYMHPGQSIQLSLPDRLDNNLSSCSYQRWFSLRTGKSFATTQSGASVKDILTPTEEGVYYRFENGYVGNPLYESSTDGKLKSMNFYMPTKKEFKEWFGEDTGFDPNWYVVACDVSYYTDFGENGNESFTDSYTEPTLSHRIVYYIQNVEAEKNWYHKAWNAGNDKFLEEYEIHLPFTRYPDGDKLELVALSKDAWAYADPNVENESPENITLTVDIDKDQNSAGIELKTKELKGANRVIQFDYPESNTSEGTKSVKGDVANPTSVIVVKKDNKNLVKFTLKFTKGTSLMTQSMINALNEGGTDLKNTSWGSYKERTPQYMDENYQFLAGLDFDYEDANPNTFANGAVKVHPYPLGWDDCSYGFYDGSKSGIQLPSGTKNAPQWGYYGIVSGYMEAASKNNNEWGWTGDFVNGSIPQTTAMEKHKENINDENKYSTYHLYVDASDRPGVIARLPFGNEVTFCAGSELFFSAWVKSAKFDNTVDNAAMLFTFMGVTNDGKYEPLYRHQTGQIPATYLNSNIKDLPGFESGNNEWFQVTGSFITDKDIINKYVSYVLQIENNSASTRGGDMYLDDVRVYLKNVEAEVNQLESTCSGTRTRLNFSIDWEQLLSRTGEPDLDNEETSDIQFPTTDDNSPYSAIGICFIDKEKYEQLIANDTEVAEAIDEAAVNIGSTTTNEDGTVNDYKYAAMFYRLNYSKNGDYEEFQPTYGFEEGSLAMNSNWFFYTKEETDRKTLTVDFYADIRPYKNYIMMVVPVDPTQDETIKDIRKRLSAQNFTEIDDPCTIKTEIQVTSQSLITVDGEILDPGDEYCEGQIRNFAVQLQAPTGEGGALEPVEETVYFDWFFGSEDEFITDDKLGVSLAEALQELRNLENGTDIETKEAVEAIQPTDVFTENMQKLIVREMETSKEGQNPRLVLHKENLNIQLLENLNLVVRPIQIELTTINEENVKICWEYIPLELKTTGKSPAAHIGFQDVNYPAEPNIRIGLAQIEGAKGEDTALKINLRGVDLIEDNGELSLNEENKYVYLVGTNDPGIDLDGYTDLDLPIGTLHEIKATKTENADNYIRISFDLEGNQTTEENNSFQFDPKEGYEYQLKVYFQEQVDNKQVTSLCDGNLVFTMKVVPEYQFWIGGETGNWNNDDNWVRANKEDMNNPTGYQNYTEPHEHKGYVPMQFTNVVIPTEHNQVELYSYTTKGHTVSIDIPATGSGVTDASTQHIEYDMLVKAESGTNYAYICEPYYSNTVNQIHFEPKAEMLHAELLTYEKAWVDYKLESNQWHTLASPLQGVVAGDFYTDGTFENGTAGIENQEYFTPITFEADDEAGYNNANDNSRISPSVYQRGWGKDAKMITVGDDEDNFVAVQGNWSAVYNNVEEEYEPGTGFSLKVLDMPDSKTEAVFRLPKADETFTYYDANGDATETKSEEIERINSGKLEISKLNETDAKISVRLQANDNSNYYLIGNPFMAHLDAAKFFDVNKSVLEQKYWTVTKDVQNVAASDGTTDWASTEGTDIPTIAPLQSFFVQKVSGTNVSDEVTFTADMQTLATETDGTNTSALILTAQTADGKTSRAAIAYDATAKTTYETSEDAELFLDSNLSDVPTIYTVAGTMATSINRTSELYNIPVGIYGNSTEMVTLSFEGLNHFSSATLYDAEKKTETPLHEGTTLTIPASTSGRYFLRAGTPTANEVIETSDIQIYTLSGNRVMVTSNVPLKDIRVYTMNGAQVKHTKAGVCSFELYLPDGIYLITAQNASGETQTEKVVVR